MFFNSIDFALFLPVVFLAYWFLTPKNLRVQNLLLLAASYFFYAFWDYRFLFLLVFSTLLDYYSGLKIHSAKEPSTKTRWLWISIIINLGFLGVFKYFNFFSLSFQSAAGSLGWEVDALTLTVILPVGISFYTFHGLSYVIDVYKSRISPVKNFIDYSVFVSFFPLLVAGPIERATHLLPQIQRRRTFDYAKAIDGLRQILWGLFKKVVIADNCAQYVDMVFNNSGGHYSGSAHLLAAILFAFQIYCDFSGYSDIALGTARLFGIELLRNFAFPYFSRDIAEFWRRWHISLSSWFRDYLYIPLGGSKGGAWMKIRNTFIIFLVSGFWHGANWTFIVWGLLNAIYIMPLIIGNKNRTNMDIVARGKVYPTPGDLGLIVITFGLTTFAWIFFRAESLGHAWTYISNMLSWSLFTLPAALPPFMVLILLALFIVIEWLGRESNYAIEKLSLSCPRPLRWTAYYTLVVLILYFGKSDQQFIYFQF